MLIPGTLKHYMFKYTDRFLNGIKPGMNEVVKGVEINIVFLSLAAKIRNLLHNYFLIFSQ